MTEIISRRSFCEMAGIGITHINTYADREKIKLEPDGRIDIALPVNQDFLRSRDKAKKVVKKKVEATEPIQFDGQSEYEERKRVELEMKKRDLMMKDVQLQKMNGEVIPTELVGVMIKYHVRQLQMELKYSFERMVSDLVIKLNGDKSEIGKSRKLISETINAASEKARAGMQKQLSQIVDDYKKSKGK